MELTKKLNQNRRRRHFAHFMLFLLFFTLPLPLPFQGFEHGTLQVDFEAWRVYLFGLVLVPGRLHVISFTIILALFFITVISTLYGKIFCGWMCPQNVFYELFDGIQGYLKKHYPFFRKRPRLQKGFDLCLAVICAFALALGVLNYFTAPHPIFQVVAFSFVFLFATFDLHVLKHTFCKKACPYAFLQKSLTDKTSMHVSWEQREGSPCGICTACVKACYVDLDVKKTPFDIDCTNCGACIDACTHVFRFKEEPSLLKFDFEEKERVPFSFLGINSYRKLSVTLGFLLYTICFVYIIATLPTIKFSLVASDKPSKTGVFYDVLYRNLTGEMSAYTLNLASDHFVFASSEKSALPIELGPFETKKQQIEIQYVGESTASFIPVEFELKGQGHTLQSQTIYFESKLKTKPNANDRL